MELYTEGGVGRWRVWLQKEVRGILVLMGLLTILIWRWVNNLHTQSNGARYTHKNEDK